MFLNSISQCAFWKFSATLSKPKTATLYLKVPTNSFMIFLLGDVFSGPEKGVIAKGVFSLEESSVLTVNQ